MNKSLIFAFLFLTVATFTHAQTSSGNLMFGGGIDFSSNSRQADNNNTYSSVSFTPSAGYFISDNFAVGLSFTIASEKSGVDPNRSTENTFGMGPFARYYFFTSNEQFAIFGQAGLSLATEKDTNGAGFVTKSSSTTFSLFPGAAYFFNEHWAVELSITGFQMTSYDPNKDNDNDKSTFVNFGLHTFSPTLGFRYHL
ncbi:MAG TPA: porin family protein [Chryseosolibacter sp.]|nr:porin family protein [Chryseosolibacter sp.]